MKAVEASAPCVDWSKIRADFPILNQTVHGAPLIYFDNGASSQKPRAVIEALVRYYERDNANVHRGIHELSSRATTAFEAARTRAHHFLGTKCAEEIIFTRGTTEAINLVAHAWGMRNLKKGDKILLTEMEHHSNIVPWQLIAVRTGAQLDYVPVTGDEGLLDLSQLEKKMASEVKIFAFTHISNALGTINPAAELCALARQYGVVTVVDGAQSAGHMPINVQQMGCDFFAFSGHKICGPTGIGVLYAREGLWAQMDPYQGGGDMISEVDFYESRWNTPPHKFEAGTPNIADAIGLHAAMDYLDHLGRSMIFQHDQELGQYAYDQLAELKGIRLLGPGCGRAGLVSFHFATMHAHDIVTLADQMGVALRGGHHCTQPLMKKLGLQATVRASFYFYNSQEEVDRFIQVMRKIKKMFGEES